MIELTLENALELLPARSEDSHKGTFGTLFSFCGSAQYRGAAVLSTLGALRTGAGIVRLCTVEKVISAVASSLPEATFLPVGEAGAISLSANEITDILTQYRPSAVLCGCGIGMGEGSANLVSALIENSTVPLIFDADALNVSSSMTPEILQCAKAPVTVTPHIGEFARLTGIDPMDVKRSAERCALDFSAKYGCVTVLKDHDTVITTPDGASYVSRLGNPGLARGGSGDILAGMIASLNAQGLDPADAAKCAVVLHGASADRCAERLSMIGMLPHDILTDLCAILRENKR